MIFDNFFLGLRRLPMQILNEQVSYFNPKPESPKEVDFSIQGNMPAFIIVGDIQAYGMPHVCIIFQFFFFFKTCAFSSLS